jgi:mono/diheme cytochrome c family protein
MLRRCVLIAFLAGACSGLQSSLLPAADGDGKSVPKDHAERVEKGLVIFKGHVRQVLIRECLECHGGKSVKADFDLSDHKLLMESGYVEKTAADSPLMALIRHSEEPHMPFKKPKLNDATIQKIAEWIDLGAPYDKPLATKSGGNPVAMQVTESDRQFWSFLPLKKPEPPMVKASGWAQTPIDRFILAKQEASGLHPNSPASKLALVRRAYFALIGLPPTPDEVDEFVNDSSPDAWPNLIDRLLQSEHYGERWARHWMDTARFGESHGYEQDYDRPHAYHYRDFLIKAFNEDLPYDQFVKWQLAGDELAPNNPLAMMATGFIGAGVFPTQLTETEFESARYDELDDIVNTTGVSFLGLSIGCARCHDHKFDPIPSVDYYNFASVFTSTIRSEIDVDLDPAANREKKAAFERQLTALEAEAEQFKQNELPKLFREWLKTYESDARLSKWETLRIDAVTSTGGTKFVPQEDSSQLATGPAPAKEVITVVAEAHRGALRSIRLETLTHDSFPGKGPGRAPNGNFALGDFKLEAAPLNGEGKARSVKLVGARATHQQNTSSLSVAASIDDDPVSGWAVDAGGIGKDQAAVFDFEKPVSFEGGTRLTITLTLNHPNQKHTIGRIRLSVSELAAPEPEVGTSGPDGVVVAALAKLKQKPDEESSAWKTGLDWFATSNGDWQAKRAAAELLRKKGPELALSKVMVSSEGFPHMSHHADGRGFPHFYPKTFVLNRGDPNQKLAEAVPGFLQALIPAGQGPADWSVAPPEGWTRTSFRRASLANWITDPQNGAGSLAARVIVNRMWHHHFGRGIVSTPNDFGFPGERPSHPELLDWLAADLVEHGWKLKRLHRLIMLSSVYMQSGDFDEQRASIDRENILLWRRAPRRLEGEAIRDSLLAVSGKLDKRLFGPGTLDENMTRRSVYFFIKRSRLIPMMMLFDWPEHLVSIGSRSNTTIAPQALMFLNSPQGRQYAMAFAGRIAADSIEQSVTNGYRLAFGRVPTAVELEVTAKFIAAQEEIHTASGAANAKQLALTDFCQTLFSMNEFVYTD